MFLLSPSSAYHPIARPLEERARNPWDHPSEQQPECNPGRVLSSNLVSNVVIGVSALYASPAFSAVAASMAAPAALLAV